MHLIYVVMGCGPPGVPLNGGSNFNSTLLNATVIHSCNEGYVLCGGNERRICQPDILWSGMVPNCTSKT